MIGGCLQSEIERHLEALSGGRAHKSAEVSDRSEIRVHGVMATGRRPDGPRRPGIAGARRERVVGALAVALTDRMDRREVDDVEPHRRDGGQALHGGAERAALDGAVLAAHGAFGSREELVPGADAGALTLDEQLVSTTHRRERGERPRREDRRKAWVADDHERLLVVDGTVAHRFRRGFQRATLGRRTVLLLRCTQEELGSHGAHERGIHAGGDLEFGGVLPCGEVIREGFEPAAPHSLLERRNEHAPPVEPVMESRQPLQRFLTERREQSHVHADQIVTFAERRRGERHGFADERGGAEVGVQGPRAHLAERNAARARCRVGGRGADGSEGNLRRAANCRGRGGARRRRHVSNLPPLRRGVHLSVGAAALPAAAKKG